MNKHKDIENWVNKHSDLVTEASNKQLSNLVEFFKLNSTKKFLDDEVLVELVQEVVGNQHLIVEKSIQDYLLLCCSSEEDKKAIFRLLFLSASLMVPHLISQLKNNNLLKEEKND